MNLENGRDIIRGILILGFVAIAWWGSRTIGLVLVAFMGVMILQSAFTGWCPADLILEPLGLKKKLENKIKKPDPIGIGQRFVNSVYQPASNFGG
jgi:hypothetical protein